MSLVDFAASRSLSLGIELELQLVDAQSGNLVSRADALVGTLQGRSHPGRIVPGSAACAIAPNTGVCDNHDQALAEMRDMRAALLDGASELGLHISGGGTHSLRPQRSANGTGTPAAGPAGQSAEAPANALPVFGQHVHVGCPGPDQALVLMHGLSRYVPHLVALGAASPFVQGEDSGFDSVRLNLVSEFQASDRAPFLQQWDAFERFFNKMEHKGLVASMKDFSWDIRPRPRLGTIEVRVLDTPLTLEKAAALAGYIQCLSRRLRVERPFELTEDSYLPYAFNRFQACRYGLNATYVDPSTGEHRPLREDILATFESLEVHAMELQAEAAINLLQAEVSGIGNDATWLRQCHAASGNLGDVVRLQAQRWRGEAP